MLHALSFSSCCNVPCDYSSHRSLGGLVAQFITYKETDSISTCPEITLHLTALFCRCTVRSGEQCQKSRTRQTSCGFSELYPLYGIICSSTDRISSSNGCKDGAAWKVCNPMTLVPLNCGWRVGTLSFVQTSFSLWCLSPVKHSSYGPVLPCTCESNCWLK